MPANAALGAGELTSLAKLEHLVPAYLSYEPLTEVGHASVNGTPGSVPIVQVTVDGASAGWTSQRKDQLCIVTRSGDVVGYYRNRLVGDATNWYPEELADADSGMAPLQSRTSGITDNDLITIYDSRPLFGIKPFVANDGTINQDYAEAVGTHNSAPQVIANVTINGKAGDYFANVTQGGTKAITAAITVTKWTTSSGSTVTYAWTYPASFTGVSGGSTATLTATAPVGSHKIRCTVTDSVGDDFEIERWIRIHDPSDPPLPILVGQTDSHNRMGRSVTVQIAQSAASVIPVGAKCAVWEEPTFGGDTVSTITDKFVGFVVKKPFQHRTGYHETQLEIVSPAHVLDKLYSAAANFSYGAATWEGLPASLSNYSFVMWWILRWRVANFLNCFNFTPFDTTGNVAQRKLISVPQGTVYSQLRALAEAYDANVGCRSDGELISVVHPALTPTADRSALVTRVTFGNNVYSYIGSDKVERIETGVLRYEGIVSDLTTDSPIGSQAPGDRTFGQGGRFDTRTGKIFDSQAQANQRAGDALVLANNPYPNIQSEIPTYWDVIEPADMQLVTVTIPADRSPTGALMTLSVVPETITRQWVGGKRAKLQMTAESLTDGVDGVYIDIRPPATNLYGNYGDITLPEYDLGNVDMGGWGPDDTTENPVTSSSARGIVLATQDGFVAFGGWSDAAPTTDQRNDIGSAIKLLQNPWDYNSLILYGSQGGMMTGAKDATPVVWTPINLATQVSQTWAHTLNFVTSDGGLTNTTGSGQTPTTDGVWTSGQGWVCTTFTLTSTTPNKTVVAVDVDLSLGGTFTITSAVMTYTITKGTFDSAGANNGFALTKAGVTQASSYTASNADADGSGKTRTISGTYTADSVHMQLRASSYDVGTGSDGTGVITKLVLNGTGANPFGGGVSSGTETFIADIAGSINRRGWFGWLADDGTNVKFNYTKNTFQSNAAVTLGGTISGYAQNIQMGSYNNEGGVGVGYCVAGSVLYKTTTWGTAWSSVATLSPGGGCVNVGYATTAGAANSGTSPEFCYVLGNVGGGTVKFVKADLGTATVNTAGNTPITGQCLVSFTTDSSYLFLGAGTIVYASNDAGDNWVATYPGGTVYGVNGSPVNHNFCLAYGPSLLAYTIDGGSNWVDLHSSYRTFADATYGAGTATTIVTAMADLDILYANEVTQ